MSEIDALINAPIGAIFFVSGAISVFFLLSIFILKKGTDLHSVLGYVYFFGLSFSNYSAAMAYYEGLLPFPAVAFTVPTTTLFIVLGLASIVPKSKSLQRIRIHIVSMICSSMCVLFGTLINWFHFNITPLDVFRWSDFFSLAILSAPVIGLAILLIIQFLSTANSYIKVELTDTTKQEEEKIGQRHETISLY